MALALRTGTVATNQNSASNTIAATMASAPQDGDWIYAVYHRAMFGDGVYGTITPPSGFALLPNLTAPAYTYGHLSVYRKKAGAAEGTSYSFSSSAEVDSQSLIVFAVSGADATEPNPGTPVTTGSGGPMTTTPQIPSFTTANANSWTIAAVGNGGQTNGHGANDYSSWTNSYTEIEDAGIAYSGLGVAHRPQATAGATGTAQVTRAVSDHPLLIVFEIKEGAAGSADPKSVTDTASLTLDGETLAEQHLEAQDETHVALTDFGSVDGSTVLKDHADAPTLALTESLALLASLERPDPLGLALAESATAAVSIDAADECAVALTEATATAVSLTRSDTWTAAVAAAAAVAASSARPDAASVALAETAALDAALAVIDTAQLALTTAAEAIDPSTLEPKPASDAAVITLAALAEVTPLAGEAVTGGFLFAYERELLRRERERAAQAAREAARAAIADQTERQIAQEITRQEEALARSQELLRLAALVQRAEETQLAAELSERTQRALEAAVARGTAGALAALDREMQRQLEEEELAVLMTLAMVA